MHMVYTLFLASITFYPGWGSDEYEPRSARPHAALLEHFNPILNPSYHVVPKFFGGGADHLK